jgi:hypothetical protein
MTDEELDVRVTQLWDMLPLPVDDVTDAELLEAAGLLIGNGLARVRGGVLTPVSLEEQLAEILGVVVEAKLRAAFLGDRATDGTAGTAVDVTE